MSETTNLKLFKNDNPETNTNEFNVDKSLNQNWDKLDNFAGTVIENVETVQTNIDTLEETLKAENEQLRKDVESSNIENTVEGQIVTVEDNSTLESKIQLYGNTEEETSEQGKNLLDPYLQNKTVNGITVSYNQSSQEITLNGTCTADNTGIVFSKFTPVELKANEVIYSKVKYISGSCTAGNNCTFGIFDASWSKNLTVKLNGITKDISSNTSFTSDVVENRVQIRFDKGDIANNLKIKVMVSKQNVAYEPFVPTKPSFKYPSEINNVSENIEINVSNRNVSKIINVGTKWKLEDNKIINLQGNTGAIIIEQIIPKGNYYLHLKLLKKPIKSTSFTFYTVENNKEKEENKLNFSAFQGFNENQVYSRNFNIDKPTKICIKQWGNADSETYEFQLWIDREQNSEYLEHEGKNTVFPLAEGQILHKDDYLADNGIHHKRKTYVFNGSENWIWSNSSDNYIGFVLDLEIDSNSELYCNKIKTYPIAQINGVDKQGIAYRNNNTGLYIRIDRTLLPAQTLVGFKQYLSENNINVEVGLVSEEIEEYTEAQKQVYDKLQKIRAYKPITNIWTNQNAIMKYTYKRDLETYINQKLGGN